VVAVAVAVVGIEIASSWRAGCLRILCPKKEK
jgi:hypothetical protein